MSHLLEFGRSKYGQDDLAERVIIAHPSKPSINNDELNCCGFQSSTNHVERRSSRRVNICLKPADGDDPYPGMLR
jgi:hypothetical protein